MRVSTVVLVLALTIGLAVISGCGNGNTSEPANTNTSTNTNANTNDNTNEGSAATSKILQDAIASKELVIGTSNDAPWSSVAQSGEAEGIIPDMLRSFLEAQNITADIKSIAMPFGSLIPSIQSGRIQIVGDAMYRTDEREKIIDFTDILFYNPEALVIQQGNPDGISSLEDLAGKTAGTYEGTVWVDTLKSITGADGSKTKVNVYPTVQDVIADLESGRLAGALIDSSLTGYAKHQNPNLKIEMSTDYKPEKAAVANALGIAKGDPEFLAAFNEWYAKAYDDGEITQIFEKWGLAPAGYWLDK